MTCVIPNDAAFLMSSKMDDLTYVIFRQLRSNYRR